MPYRDDRRVLQAQRDELRRKLEELRPRTEAARDAIQAQETLERDLAVTEAKLAQHPSLLDATRVASPCDARWDAMKGDDRVRFCAECQKNVYNLSALTRDDAILLLANREGSLCIRLHRRADGTVLTADCPVGQRRKVVRLALYGAAGAGVLAAAGAAAWSVVAPRHTTMGSVPAPPPRQQALWPTPDVYVPQPLRPDPEPGLVLAYHQARQPGRRGVDWAVYDNGRAVRTVIGSFSHEAPLTTDARDAAWAIVALSKQLRPEGAGAVPAWADSAVPRSYELFGTGLRTPKDAERARLFELVMRLAFAGEDPYRAPSSRRDRPPSP